MTIAPDRARSYYNLERSSLINRFFYKALTYEAEAASSPAIKNELFKATAESLAIKAELFNTTTEATVLFNATTEAAVLFKVTTVIEAAAASLYRTLSCYTEMLAPTKLALLFTATAISLAFRAVLFKATTVRF